MSLQTPADFTEAVEAAATLLRAGELVVVPTETVYGLAANAFDPAAVSKIYTFKGRPSHNPIIVHVATADMIRECAGEWSEEAQRLARAFWPGPLTLVVPKSERVPMVVTAGGATVGLRWPSHAFMQALIRRCGFPLAAPSANPANQLSPTSADHVLHNLPGPVGLVVDGGPSNVGIESTVVDLCRNPAVILRPGMIHREALASVIPVLSPAAVEGTQRGCEAPLKSPGLLSKHYSPRAPLRLLRWRDGADLREQIDSEVRAGRRVQILCHSRIPAGFAPDQVSVIPHDAEAFARALYAELHQCDQTGVELIVVECPPDGPEWHGVQDRLTRASASSES
ncbi:MAG: threonylcarbamoyl-AMP synthase [Verrucomicrobia bacterium]|nr:threonylcarbamoyl-AMP synthase [Verrucomicrobiota bacterium]MBI3870202.1 threonylcarbamoyl-AMP synthase [Verrucomicrobiota bacterium]